MRNYIALLIFSIIICLPLQAKDVYQPEQHELILLTNQWLNTNNASGISIYNIQSHGNTELGYNDASGDYHRAQEGNRQNGLNFNSERYDNINDNWSSWGRFEFNMTTEFDRAWSNVFHTYNNSPYIFGDSIKGGYDTQLFTFQSKLSRKITERWAAGVSLDYIAGDMSRQRDARTRTYLVNYSLIPSVTFKLSEHHILGLTSGFHFEKEKMPGITTVQTDPKIDYYFFLGNENAYSVLDGYKGFNRQYVNRNFSFGLQYNLISGNFNWFNSVEFVSKSQEILGSERESPGNYETQTISFNSKANIIQSNRLINITLSGTYNAGTADEYLQERKTTRDTTTGSSSYKWNTLYAYNNRFTTDSYNADINISLRNLLKNGTDYSWKAAIDARIYGFSNKYYLPFSVTETQRLRLGISGSKRIFNKGEHLVSLNARGGFEFNLQNNLELNSIATAVQSIGSTTFETATNKIANNILLPDKAFYSENVYDFKIDARYSFPMKIKANKLAGFAKVFYGNKVSKDLGSWMIFGVSVGLITF